MARSSASDGKIGVLRIVEQTLHDNWSVHCRDGMDVSMITHPETTSFRPSKSVSVAILVVDVWCLMFVICEAARL